ncbi:MAG: hypothetical protein K2X91_16890 [Thermoleophilia bacterium]|nr:hypothetical protein [Thermoleophilia bacterium]
MWINRLVNLAGDDRSARLIAVHLVIAVISLALAVPVAIAGWRLRRVGRGNRRRGAEGPGGIT